MFCFFFLPVRQEKVLGSAVKHMNGLLAVNTNFFVFGLNKRKMLGSPQTKTVLGVLQDQTRLL